MKNVVLLEPIVFDILTHTVFPLKKATTFGAIALDILTHTGPEMLPQKNKKVCCTPHRSHAAIGLYTFVENVAIFSENTHESNPIRPAHTR